MICPRWRNHAPSCEIKIDVINIADRIPGTAGIRMVDVAIEGDAQVEVGCQRTVGGVEDLRVAVRAKETIESAHESHRYIGAGGIDGDGVGSGISIVGSTNRPVREQ